VADAVIEGNIEVGLSGELSLLVQSKSKDAKYPGGAWDLCYPPLFFWGGGG